MSVPVVDLSRNHKQKKFFRQFLSIISSFESSKISNVVELNPIRYLFYGGAIRGGKTFVCLAILCLLCRKYAGTRWHIIRRSTPDLKSTTIPSLEKILKNANVRWNRAASDYFVEFPNGSRIYFMSENFKNDKDLDRFKGLETNGVLLEQIEELQEATFDKCKERVGSWYVKNMPPALIFSTFNPTWNWVKTRFHDVWQKNGVQAPFYYLEASPDDNPFVTDDQRRHWELMDSQTKARFIDGIWDIEVEGQFMFGFSDEHVKEDISFDVTEDTYFSFDFNVDPMTCTVWQTDQMSYAHCVEEFRIPDSDTYALCAAIRDKYPLHNMSMYVTGDASGANRMSGARNHINHFDIIHEELGIPFNRMKIPTHNPFISDSRAFVNAFVEHFENFGIHSSCEWLIKDCRFVLSGIDEKGKVEIKKKGYNKFANMDNAQLGHLLDTMRYFIHAAFPDFVRYHRS